MSGHAESKKVVFLALAGNLIIGIAKFIAAMFTNSSAMFSEAIHSFVDTSNQCLLLYGIKCSKKKSDETHMFGHGLQLYFFTFLTSILIFVFGAVVSIYDGAIKIIHPEPMKNILVNYIILFASLLIEGSVFKAAFSQLKSIKGKKSFYQYIKDSKNPINFTTFIEDAGAITGLIIAIVSITISHFFHAPIFDGISSIIIGVLMAVSAYIIGSESMSLLTGEAVSKETSADIRKMILDYSGIEKINELMSVQFSPSFVLVTMSLDFKDDMSAADVENIVSMLDSQIKNKYPDIKKVFIEAQSFEAHILLLNRK